VKAAIAEKFQGARHRSRIAVLLKNIAPALDGIDQAMPPEALLSSAVEANVRWTIRQLLESPEGKARAAKGDIKLVGAVYDLGHGPRAVPGVARRARERLLDHPFELQQPPRLSGHQLVVQLAHSSSRPRVGGHPPGRSERRRTRPAIDGNELVVPAHKPPGHRARAPAQCPAATPLASAAGRTGPGSSVASDHPLHGGPDRASRGKSRPELKARIHAFGSRLRGSASPSGPTSLRPAACCRAGWRPKRRAAHRCAGRRSPATRLPRAAAAPSPRAARARRWSNRASDGRRRIGRHPGHPLAARDAGELTALCRRAVQRRDPRRHGVVGPLEMVRQRRAITAPATETSRDDARRNHILAPQQGQSMQRIGHTL